MKICDYLNKECITLAIKPESTKEEIFYFMLNLAKKVYDCVDIDEALIGLKKREALGSTGVGHNVAIPHTGVKCCKEIIPVMGIIRDGIDFQSIDNIPVKIILLILFPHDEINMQLRFLARVSRILRKENIRKNLISSKNYNDVFSALKCYEDVHFS